MMAPQKSKKTPADSTQGAASPQNGAPEGEEQQEPGSSKGRLTKYHFRDLRRHTLKDVRQLGHLLAHLA